MSAAIVAMLGLAFSCPQNVQVEQSAVGVSPDWTVDVSKEPRPLEEGAVFAGYPSLRSKIQGTHTGGVMTWTLLKGEHWVVCTYEGSSVTLTRKIDAPARCTFKASDFVGGTGPAAFECKDGQALQGEK